MGHTLLHDNFGNFSQRWKPYQGTLQLQLEQIEESFLRTIRLSGADDNKADLNFDRYRDHLLETGWSPLWK